MKSDETGAITAAAALAANGADAPDECELSAAAEIKVLKDAIAAGHVSFHYVAHAWFRLRDPIPERHRREFERLFPQLVEAFAEPRGGVITAYLCRHIRVAAVLTDIEHAARPTAGMPTRSGQRAIDAGSDESGSSSPPWWRMSHWRDRRRRAESRRAASNSAIHLEPTYGQPDDWKAKELLFRCMDLHYRALQFLTPKPRKICMRMVFSIVIALLGSLDHPRLGPRARPFSSDLRAVESLESQLEQARRYYDRSAQHQAQYEYFIGMVAGLAALVIALVVLGFVTGAKLLGEPLLAAPLAGGAGAVVSVMARMTRGQLTLNYESGRATIRTIGVIRPVLGALFGGALYLLLASGLLTISQAPGDATKLLYFYTGIAFLAGFSERWAQDVVSGGMITAADPSWAATGSGAPAARANPTPRVPGAG